MVERIVLPVLSVAAGVRELTGQDERIVQSTDTRVSVTLLERVTEGVEPRQLSAADRDRLLAAVYRLTYGNSISNTAHCAACGNLFDFRFELSSLIEQLDASTASQKAADSGVFRTSRGSEFRLPTAADEIASNSPADLMARCLLSRADGETDEEIEAAMESAAPLIDLELDGTCPECDRRQALGFSIQRYLLEALVRDRSGLFREVHRLASAYGWSLTEILSLRRTERKMFVELADSEKRYAVGAFS